MFTSDAELSVFATVTANPNAISRVVERDDREKRLCERSVRVVLPDNHDRRGGRRCGCDRAEHERKRKRLSGKKKSAHDRAHCAEPLEDRNHHGADADLTEIRKLELRADRQCDEAERHLRHHRDRRCRVGGNYLENVRPDDKPGDKIPRHVGQSDLFRKAAEKKSAEKHYPEVKKHAHYLLSPFPRAKSIGRENMIPTSG